MVTKDMLKSSELEKELGFEETEIGKEVLRQRKALERKESLKKQIKTIKKISKEIPPKIAKELRKKIRKLKKAGKKKKKLELKAALQAAIGRQRLLQALVAKKRPVSILRRVEDKIPSVFINGIHRGEQPRKQLSFLGRGRVL